MNVLLNFTGNVLVVGEGAGCYTDDEENLGKEPSQVSSVQVSSGCPLQELSMTKEVSSGSPLQELSMTKEASSGHPLQEVSMSKEASSDRPLQELSITKDVRSYPLDKPSSEPTIGKKPFQIGIPTKADR